MIDSNIENVKDKKILIVDDVEINIQILVSSLQDDYQLSVAKNGKEALKAAQKVKPDLILLDIMMPEMDGFEACQALKNNAATRDIPVIFLTGLSQQENKEKGFSLGGVDYITKPFEIPEVRARINTHLSLKAAREKLLMHNEKLDELVRIKSKTISMSKELLEKLLYPCEVFEFFRFYFELLKSNYGLDNNYIYKVNGKAFDFVGGSNQGDKLLKEDPGLQDEITEHLKAAVKRKSRVVTTVHYYKTVLFYLEPDDENIYIVVIVGKEQELDDQMAEELETFNKYLAVGIRDNNIMSGLDNLK